MPALPPTGMPTAAPRFGYLNDCIGLTFLYYVVTILIVVVLLLTLKCRDYTKRVPPKSSDGDTRKSCCEKFKNQSVDFFTGLQFESVYVSFNRSWSIALCIYRGLCFAFFLAIPCIYQYIIDRGYNWIYFTFWNVDIITLYYLFAFVASVVGLSRNSSSETMTSWSSSEKFLGTLVQFFFTVAAPTALFVTVFAYSFLGANLGFGNVSYHLMNTLSLTFEMMLNSIVFRWEHVTIVMSWAMLYLLYTWGMVGTNQEPTYPYSALRTNSSGSMVWYTLLYVFILVSFVIWYILSRLKIWLRGEAMKPYMVLNSDDTPDSMMVIARAI